MAEGKAQEMMTPTMASEPYRLGRAAVAITKHSYAPRLEHVAFNELGRIEDRADLAKGALDELLEEGRWPEAVLFASDSRLAPFINQKDDDFKKKLLMSVRRPYEPYRQEDALETIITTGNTDLFFMLLPHLEDLSAESIERLGNIIPRDYEEPEEQSRALTNAEARANVQAYPSQAIKLYLKTQNIEGIRGMWDRLMEHPFSYYDDLSTISSYMPDPSLSHKEIVANAIAAVANNPDLVEGWTPGAERLLILLEDAEQLGIEPDNKESLLELALSSAASESIASQSDDVRLRWAKAHTDDYSLESYSIFWQQGYYHTQRYDAVRAMIEKPHNLIGEKHKLSDIDKDDLEIVYPQYDLNKRLEIARHLVDVSKLQFISRELGAKDQPEEAYKVWLQADGDRNSEHFQAVRRRALQNSFNDPLSVPNLSWLHSGDVEGRIKAFDMALERGYYVLAMELAESVSDQERADLARDRFFESKPYEAYRYLIMHSDHGNLEFAVSKLSEAYELPEERILALIYAR